MENNELEKKEIKVKLNLKNELEKINTKTIFEFKKTMENFDLEKVKIYKFNDNEKTLKTFLGKEKTNEIKEKFEEYDFDTIIDILKKVGDKNV